MLGYKYDLDKQTWFTVETNKLEVKTIGKWINIYAKIFNTICYMENNCFDLDKVIDYYSYKVEDD